MWRPPRTGSVDSRVSCGWIHREIPPPIVVDPPAGHRTGTKAPRRSPARTGPSVHGLVEDVATDPGMHGDRGGGSGVHRPRRTVLGDGEHVPTGQVRLLAQPGTLLSEQIGRASCRERVEVVVAGGE